MTANETQKRFLEVVGLKENSKIEVFMPNKHITLNVLYLKSTKEFTLQDEKGMFYSFSILFCWNWEIITETLFDLEKYD